MGIKKHSKNNPRYNEGLRISKNALPKNKRVELKLKQTKKEIKEYKL